MILQVIWERLKQEGLNSADLPDTIFDATMGRMLRLNQDWWNYDPASPKTI